ncbi:MAG: stage II sporulation protein M [Anaerolineae bacterium]
MRVLRSSLSIIRDNGRAYLAINIVYYGLVILAMIFVATQPELQRSLTEVVATSFTSGPLETVGAAYGSGNVALAATITFVVNFFLGAFLYITLPSLLIPFAGLCTGVIRAVLWGLLLSPAMPELRLAMIPHSLTVLLEGQAYVLAMLGSYLLWSTALRRGEGSGNFLSRYRVGLSKNVRLYLLIAIVLAVAALYEALEVIFIVGASAR